MGEVKEVIEVRELSKELGHMAYREKVLEQCKNVEVDDGGIHEEWMLIKEEAAGSMSDIFEMRQ